jgi:hypothetical protein
MTRKSIVLMVAGIAIGSTGVFVAPDAEAVIPHPWRNHHASTCMAQAGTIGTAIPAGQVFNNYPNTLWLVCPVDGDTNFNFKTPGVHAEVTGWANNAWTWGAEACVTWAVGGGGACGSQHLDAGGVRHADLDLSAWNSASNLDYPFVRVMLGPNYQASMNVVWGVRLWK